VENEQDLMTRAEVAEMCRQSVETVRYWAYAGKGPKSFRVGKRALYRRADVEKWLREQYAAS
jgi:hypothetical protein